MTVPVDLSKLSDGVKNDVVKKDVYNKLVTKVDNIDTCGFVLKTKYDKDKSELENKIPDTRGLVKKTDYNTKITEIEGKIPDISNLAAKTSLTAIENKIPSVSSNLVKKADYDTKITGTENRLNNHNHDKYIDNLEFNKLAVDVFNARIAQANLVTKTDFDAKLSGFNRKITKNKTDHLLVKNGLSTLKNKIPDISNLVKKTDNTKIAEIDGKFDKIKQDVIESLIFLSVGNLLFDGGGGTQAYLIFQPVYKYFKFTSNTNYISSWKSKGNLI